MGDGWIRALHRYRFSGIIATVSRLALGTVFVYAAIPKLLDWHAFADAITRYRMLPGFLVDIVALAMPSLELVVGLMLILGVYRSTAALMTILMNMAFMVAMTQALVRGLDTSCGCFSADTGPLSWWDVGRDLVFIAMAWLVIREDRRV